MIRFNELHTQVITGTTSATPGTRTTHAHKLQYAPSLNRILIQTKGPNDDVDNSAAGPVVVVAASASTISVKCKTASVPFTAFIFKSDNEAPGLPDKS